MHKKFFLPITLLVSVLTFILTPIYIAQADGMLDYLKPRCTASSCKFTFIAPIPIIGFNLSESNNVIDITGGEGVAKYISGVYKTLIAVVAAVAIVYMVYGGMLYATTDAMFKKSLGIGMFKNALAGLGLALVSYTLLATLNPYLLSTNFNPADISVDAIPPPDGGANGGGGAVDPVTGETIPAGDPNSGPLAEQVSFINSISAGERSSDGRLNFSAYGYDGDTSSDSNTREGRGNNENLIVPGSVALSPDLISKYNPRHGASVYVNGKLVGYYDDATGADSVNTIDFYDPGKPDFGGNGFFRTIPANQWTLTFGDVRAQAPNPSN